VVHRGFTEGYPTSIRSLLLFFREERSNSAQKVPLFITGRKKGRLYAPHISLIIPKVEPRASSSVHGNTSRPTGADTVMPGCTREYIVGYIPGWTTSPYTHPGVYTRYPSPPPGYNRTHPFHHPGITGHISLTHGCILGPSGIPHGCILGTSGIPPGVPVHIPHDPRV